MSDNQSRIFKNTKRFGIGDIDDFNNEVYNNLKTHGLLKSYILIIEFGFDMYNELTSNMKLWFKLTIGVSLYLCIPLCFISMGLLWYTARYPFYLIKKNRKWFFNE